MNIKENPKEILEAILKAHGIEVIREFIGAYNRKARKKSTRVNNNLDVIKAYYDLVINRGYSSERAKEQVAEQKNIQASTVRNHIQNFRDEMKENNLLDIGYTIEVISKKYGSELTHYVLMDIVGKFFGIDRELAEIYRYEYLQRKNKPEGQNATLPENHTPLLTQIDKYLQQQQQIPF